MPMDMNALQSAAAVGKTQDSLAQALGPHLCRHCGKPCVRLRLTIIARLSHNGRERKAVKGVDACIADIVRALNAGGVKTTSCCCGHGNAGSIMLADGRELLIKRAKESSRKGKDL